MSHPRTPVSGNGHRRQTVGVVSRTVFAREALVRAISAEAAFRAVDLGSGQDAVARAHAADPDLVLIDLRPADAVPLSEALLEAIPGTRPVAVHRGAEPELLLRFAEAGFVGFVSTDCTYRDLLQELRGVLTQDSNCPPQLAGAIIRSLRRKSGPVSSEDHLGVLTPRERQVARLLERRYSNKEIATELGIEFGTVKNHVHSVLTKLHLHNRWEVPHLKAVDRRD